MWSLLPLPYSRRPTLKVPGKPADEGAQALLPTRSSCYETARVADTAARRPSRGSSFSHSPLKSSRSRWPTHHRLGAGGRLNAKRKALGVPASCRFLRRVTSSRVPGIPGIRLLHEVPIINVLRNLWRRRRRRRCRLSRVQFLQEYVPHDVERKADRREPKRPPDFRIWMGP